MISDVNLQALVALGFFVLSVGIARTVLAIQAGRLPGGDLMVLYLRLLLGFLLTASVVLAFYSFAGMNVLFQNG